ncbi:MAG: glycoside hydrolase family 15 protein [Actinomycetota bacterium]
MPLRIEDYALIGDTHTAALVGRDGSIDWLCLPRFDSPACFAALLGDESNGRWVLAPAERSPRVGRRYRGDTLVLETEFSTSDGVVRVIDFMPPREATPDLVRIVEGVSGTVPMSMELVIRFDYGSSVPWVRRLDGRLAAIAGAHGICLTTPVETRGVDMRTISEFHVSEGDRIPFVLTWHESHETPPKPVDAIDALADTTRWWEQWRGKCDYGLEWDDAVVTSLKVLKALTYGPTGGIVAAPTSSLPEKIGGIRNWDYRYCWLRDATFTLYALLVSGFTEEACAWRDWLVRAVAGSPSQMQIMYGVAGERHLPEFELDWLSGYETSAPVRVGNAASSQFQLDVFGEVMDALHVARARGIEPEEVPWEVQRTLMDFLEANWTEPDEGIWEVRGPRRDFTHSKMMAWVACDRAVKAVERFDLPGDVRRWRALRDEIHADVCRNGYNPEKNAFVQHYGSERLDASLLMMPLVGFLPASDERVTNTVEAIGRELLVDGFVLRYRPEGCEDVDGLPPGEGAFLPCTFWYADNLALMGRADEARTIFERLLAVRNDVGLLAEEYDPHHRRLLGNFPQAFTHVGLINTARNLTHGRSSAQVRGGD